MFGEREILAVGEDKGDICSPFVLDNKWPVMSFNCFGLGTSEAVLHAYNVLREGASHNLNPDGPAALPWSELCFYMVDKFGVHWWVAI